MGITIFSNIQDYNLVAPFRTVAGREGGDADSSGALRGAAALGNLRAFNYITCGMLTWAMLAKSAGEIMGRAGKPTTSVVSFLVLKNFQERQM